MARKYWSSNQIWVSIDHGATWETYDTGSVPDRNDYNFLAYGNGTFIRPNPYFLKWHLVEHNLPI